MEGQTLGALTNYPKRLKGPQSASKAAKCLKMAQNRSKRLIFPHTASSLVPQEIEFLGPEGGRPRSPGFSSPGWSVFSYVNVGDGGMSHSETRK